jgi:hypothetical protein
MGSTGVPSSPILPYEAQARGRRQRLPKLIMRVRFPSPALPETRRSVAALPSKHTRRRTFVQLRLLPKGYGQHRPFPGLLVSSARMRQGLRVRILSSSTAAIKGVPLRGAGPGASARAQPLGGPPSARRATPDGAANQQGSRYAGRCCIWPSSWRSSVPLPATVSRSLPSAASRAIGSAEPRHSTRSQASGAHEDDGNE